MQLACRHMESTVTKWGRLVKQNSSGPGCWSPNIQTASIILDIAAVLKLSCFRPHQFGLEVAQVSIQVSAKHVVCFIQPSTCKVPYERSTKGRRETILGSAPSVSFRTLFHKSKRLHNNHGNIRRLQVGQMRPVKISFQTE